MSFLSGIARSLINPASLAQLAMGPAGWASLAVRTIGTAVAKEVIQQVGQQLGLPQSMISLAQNTFSSAMGGSPDLASSLGQAAPSSLNDAVGMVASQFNMSPAQEGDLLRSGNNMVSQLVQSILDHSKAESEKTATQSQQSGSPTGGKGYLQALAEAMGSVMDAKMDEITSLSDQVSQQANSNSAFTSSIGKSDNSVKAGSTVQDNQAKLGTLNSKLQAATQELSIMQNAMTNVLKTIGEAESGMARKG